MPLDREDLQARLRLATSGDTAKGLLFRAVCAELQRQLPRTGALQSLLGRHQKASWQELMNYPVSEFLELGYGAAELLELRAGNFHDALTLLGFRVGDMFLKSVVGRVAVRMAAGKSPLEILAYAPAVYGSAVNYGRRSYERLSPERAVLRVRGDFFPAAYHLGVVRAGVGVLGHEPAVQVKQLDLLDFDAEVTWPASEPRVGL